MRRYLIIAGTTVAVIILLAVSLEVTSTPGFCRSCHEMKSDWQAWSSSAHANVNCEACHIGPGVRNFVIGKVLALREVALHFTNSYERPINQGSELSTSLPPAHCRACHNAPGRRSNGRVVFDHAAHAQADYTCPYCHNRTAHPNLKGYTARIAMPFCTGCHTKQGASVKCGTCHPAGFRTKPAVR